MAEKNPLEGLIKLSLRKEWIDRFEKVMGEHLLPACDETGLDVDELAPLIGEETFMASAWSCAFEDFLTREFDGENAIDDYLKRRGWKESAAARNYIAALRHSTMSLYEVGEVVAGMSFEARDLLRGGDPVLIHERNLTRSLQSGDRIAVRVVDVGTRRQIGSGVLLFDDTTADTIADAFQKIDSLSDEDKRAIAAANGGDFDETVFSKLSGADRVHAAAPVLTTFWLLAVIDGLRQPDVSELRNSDGDELLLCDASHPLAAGTTEDDVRAVFSERSDFSSTSPTTWDWIAPVPTDEGSQPLLASERSQDGMLILGDLRLEDGFLALSTNSRARADRGCALLAELFGPRLGAAKVTAMSLDDIVAAQRATMSN